MDIPQSWNVTKGFDPFTQTLLLKLPDGEIAPITIFDLGSFTQYGIRICINYSSQVGASAVLLVILLILTNPDKRRSVIFALNCITLVLNIIQRLLQTLYFTGAFYNPYAYFSGDYSQITANDLAINIAAIVLQTIQIACLETSLVLQVRAVCVTMSRLWQSGILVVSLMVAGVVVGFRMAVMVLNSEAVIAIASFGNYQWLAATQLYVLTGSICFFSAIFTGKLLFALRQRKKLGLKSFGPMQIIFIMGCQTLIIPAIFSVLQWVSDAPELGSQVLTLTSIFLPLSAIWASQSLSGGPSNSAIDKSARRRLMGFTRSGFSQNKASAAEKSTQNSSRKTNTTDTPSTVDEPETPRFSMIRKDDGDDVEAAGGLHIYRKQSESLCREGDSVV